MVQLDPDAILARLARDIPPRLLRNLYLIGSLAAGFHFRAALESRAVNTKDADLVVQPVGNLDAVAKIASNLRKSRWNWKLDFGPVGSATTPEGKLPDIRLYPPGRNPKYWVELQGLPKPDQAEPVRRTRVVIDGEHFAVPAFRFAGITARGLRDTPRGIRYADPAMMALSNLLAHPEVGTHRMSTAIAGRRCLRSAKDLGRVLAFARLCDRREVQGWVGPWLRALRSSFPRTWRAIGVRAGAGLRALLADEDGMSDAHWAMRNGLLSGLGVGRNELVVVGEGFLADVVEPFEKRCRPR